MKKRKGKSITDYLSGWKAAAGAVLFFGIAIAYVLALAGDVKQVKESVHWLELKDLNVQILDYQRMYKCYPPKSCLLKIDSTTERKALQTLLDGKDKLLKKLGLPKEGE